jgi:hypothetical protein
MQAFLLGFYQESIFVFLIMLREGSLKWIRKLHFGFG